jgi:outer membrane biosynthesis protein TonB
VAASSTNPPPAATGGNAKYAVIGVLLLGAAVVIWLLMQNCGSEPVAQVNTPQGRDAGPPTKVEPELYIPPPEPDSGPQVDAGPRRTKIIYRTRYVAGDWDCAGDIPTARIQAIVAENRRQVRNCYERALKRNNQLQGNLTLSMKIARDGSVEATRVGGSLGDPEVFACVRSLASRWHFPNPSGGNCAVVRAPFSLTPQGN